MVKSWNGVLRANELQSAPRHVVNVAQGEIATVHTSRSRKKFSAKTASLAQIGRKFENMRWLLSFVAIIHARDMTFYSSKQ